MRSEFGGFLLNKFGATIVEVNYENPSDLDNLSTISKVLEQIF